MAENITKLPVKVDKTPTPPTQAWRPLENLRREIDSLFDDFGLGMWRSPFRSSFFEPLRRSEMAVVGPAVDVSETDKAYEIAAELAGMDDKNIDVKVANGVLTIKGEKQDEKEEKKKDYYMRERSYGSFERSFEVPASVATDKIEATFKKGVLTVTLPKKAEAQTPAKKIEVKAA